MQHLKTYAPTFSCFAVIVLLLLTHSIARSQDKVIVVWYQDHTRYCLTEPQALRAVESKQQNEIHKGLVIDLKAEISALKAKSVDAEKVIEATEELGGIEKERHEMTKKELRKAKRKAVGQWFKHNMQKLLIGSGGVAVGVGIGLGVSPW